jgi:predicted AAA+ superfamily ATPase
MDSKNYIPRSIENYAFDENLIGRHMVFIAGPRQVGKTLLAKNWLKRKGCASLYFNWDEPSIRRAYLANSRFFESPQESPAVVFKADLGNPGY